MRCVDSKKTIPVTKWCRQMGTPSGVIIRVTSGNPPAKCEFEGENHRIKYNVALELSSHVRLPEGFLPISMPVNLHLYH